MEGPLIGRATIGAPPDEKAEGALPNLLEDHHAAGIATAGGFIYWADPVQGTIGRAKLDGSEAIDYVDPGETCAETHPETEPGQKQCAPATPRYVAVGPCAGGGECIYWTNTGPLGGDLNKIQRNEPALGAGTIGRAKLDGAKSAGRASVKADFIAGASNPQGIAVNASHVYWANSLLTKAGRWRSTSRGRRSTAAGSNRPSTNWARPSPLRGGAERDARLLDDGEGQLGFGTVNSIPLDGLKKGKAKPR